MKQLNWSNLSCSFSLLLTMGVNESVRVPVDFVQWQLQQMCHSIEHLADEGVESKVFIPFETKQTKKLADDNNSNNNNNDN